MSHHLLLGGWGCLELLWWEVDEVSAVQIPFGVLSVEQWFLLSVEAGLAHL